MRPITSRRDGGAARRAGTGRRISNVAIALCCLGIGLSAWALSTERRVTAAQDALVSETTALARGETPSLRPAAANDTARIALVDAVRLATRAAASPDGPGRAALLADAQAAADRALEIRPRSGEAALASAYVLALQNGAGDPAALAMLARSYDDAPLLTEASRWRVGVAAAHWGSLPARTRTAAVEEAVWAARRSEEENDMMFALARSSPLYARFILRWRALREADRR